MLLAFFHGGWLISAFGHSIEELIFRGGEGWRSNRLFTCYDSNVALGVEYHIVCNRDSVMHVGTVSPMVVPPVHGYCRSVADQDVWAEVAAATNLFSGIFSTQLFFSFHPPAQNLQSTPSTARTGPGSFSFLLPSYASGFSIPVSSSSKRISKYYSDTLRPSLTPKFPA